HHDQVVVLEHDVQRDVLGDHMAPGRRRHLDPNGLARARAITRALRAAVHGHVTVRDERGRLIPGDVSMAGTQDVQPGAGVLVTVKGVPLGLPGGTRVTSHPSRRSGTPEAVAAAASAGRGWSSHQSTHASRMAPQLIAMSATLNVGQRMVPMPTSMKSTTPWGERTRSIRLPNAPEHTRATASTRCQSPSRAVVYSLPST